MKPLVRNAADEGQVQDAEKNQKRGRDLEIEDLVFLLGTASGRRFFRRYLERCGVFNCSFTGDNYTFFREGERNIGLQMLRDINEAKPEAYAQMMSEKGEP